MWKGQNCRKRFTQSSDLEIALLSRKISLHKRTSENLFFVRRLKCASQVPQPTLSLSGQAGSLSWNKQDYGIEIQGWTGLTRVAIIKNQDMP